MNTYEVLVTGYAAVFVEAENVHEAGMLATQTLDTGAMLPVQVEVEELTCPDKINQAKDGADLCLYAPCCDIEEKSSGK